MNKSRTLVNGESTSLFSSLKFKIILHYDERNFANSTSFLQFFVSAFVPLINENTFSVIFC